MDVEKPAQIEVHIAQSRLVLSLVAMAAVFVDPTEPFVSGRLGMTSGGFTIDPWVFLVMGAHLTYSLLIYAVIARGWMGSRFVPSWTPWTDVLFGAAIAFMTEGASSPFYPFFIFAVVVAGFRFGLKQALQVTATGVALYMGLILFSTGESVNVYIMRPAYLAIVGYLVGYLGQQRLVLEQEVQELGMAAQRHRIARDLHDGFAQALAGINLRIEGCRRLLRRSDTDDALAELTELQSSVRREYDELRTYMQSLAGVPFSAAGPGGPSDTRLSLGIAIDGTLDRIDHVLQIVREAVNNVRRHAFAASARVAVAEADGAVNIEIDDDGIGLGGARPPWSIASRVDELGGTIEVARDGNAGTRILIRIPYAQEG